MNIEEDPVNGGQEDNAEGNFHNSLLAAFPAMELSDNNGDLIAEVDYGTQKTLTQKDEVQHHITELFGIHSTSMNHK